MCKYGMLDMALWVDNADINIEHIIGTYLLLSLLIIILFPCLKYTFIFNI